MSLPVAAPIGQDGWGPFRVTDRLPLAFCSECKIACVLGEVEAHLSSHHPMTFPCKEGRAATAKLLRSYSPALVATRDDFVRDVLPLVPMPMFDELVVLAETGHGCRSCARAVRGEGPKLRSKLSTHMKAHHGDISVDVDIVSHFDAGILFQQFFPQGLGSGYFRMLPGPSLDAGAGDDDADVSASRTALLAGHNAILQNVHALAQADISSDGSEETQNGWLRRVGWQRHLGHLPRDAVRAMVALPLPEREPLLHEVGVAFGQAVWAAHDDIAQSRIGWPSRSAVMKSRPDSVRAPLCCLQRDTVRGYIRVGVHVLAYVLRTAGPGREVPLQWRLSDGQQQAIDALLKSSAASPRAALAASLFLELVADELGDDEYTSGLLSALAALGLGAGGQWLAPRDYTKNLAAVLHLARVLVVRDARLRTSASGPAKGPGREQLQHDIVRPFSARYLSQLGQPDAVPSPMAWVMSTLAYGYRIHINTAAIGRIVWSADGAKVFYRDQSTSLPQLRDLAARLLADLRTVTDSLLCGTAGDARARERCSPKGLLDDRARDEPEYSFLDHPGNRERLAGAREALLLAVTEEPAQRAQWLPPGSRKHCAYEGLAFVESRAVRYGHDMRTFLELLLCISYLFSGQSARGTELPPLRWRNTSSAGPREVVILHDRVCLAARYHKGYGLQGQAKHIYRYLPDAAGLCLVEYLAKVVPFWQTVQASRRGHDGLSPLLWTDDITYRRHEDLSLLVSESGSPSPVDADTDDEGPSPLPVVIPTAAPRRFEQWNHDRFARVLARETKQHHEKALTISSWRHISIAIARRYLLGGLGAAAMEPNDPFHLKIHSTDDLDPDARLDLLNLAGLDPMDAGLRGAVDDDAGEGWAGGAWSRRPHGRVGNLRSTLANQAGHDVRTEEIHYAREVNDIDTSSVGLAEKHLVASLLWQQLLHVRGAVDNPPDDEQAEEHSKPGDRPPTALVPLPAGPPHPIDCEAQRERHRRLATLTDTDLAAHLQANFGHAAASGPLSFRHRQLDALRVVLLRAPAMLYVAPTGGGKSLLFMLPALIDPRGTTIVIVPLLALQGDLLRRCRRVGISCHVFLPESAPKSASLVFVTPETFDTRPFQCFALRLLQARQLDRVVVDEAHVVLDAKDSFRPSYMRIGQQVVAWAVPLVLVTATLPPGDEPELMSRMRLLPPAGLALGAGEAPSVRCRVVRSPTGRPNIAYRVVRVRAWSDIEGEAVRQARAQLDAFAPSAGLVLVYATTKAAAESLARALGCGYYHSDSGAPAAKERALARWQESDRVIVATTALGLGIDLPRIRAVVHAGASYNVRDYAQESGRCGRDGSVSTAVVVTSPGMRRRDKGLVAFLDAKICRRSVLAEVMDGETAWPPCLEAQAAGPVALCDLCERRMGLVPEPSSSLRAPGDATDETGDLSRQGTVIPLSSPHSSPTSRLSALGSSLIPQSSPSAWSTPTTSCSSPSPALTSIHAIGERFRPRPSTGGGHAVGVKRAASAAHVDDLEDVEDMAPPPKRPATGSPDDFALQALMDSEATLAQRSRFSSGQECDWNATSAAVEIFILSCPPDICPGCLVQRGGICSHDGRPCPHTPAGQLDGLRLEADTLRRRIRSINGLVQYVHCFACGLPQSLCPPMSCKRGGSHGPSFRPNDLFVLIMGLFRRAGEASARAVVDSYGRSDPAARGDVLEKSGWRDGVFLANSDFLRWAFAAREQGSSKDERLTHIVVLLYLLHEQLRSVMQ